jgi:membrane associated rhomboid family serine protease
LSGFGGSVAVLLLAPMSAVVGASGAIFGLFGAFFVIQRKLGGNSVQLFVVIGLNFAIGFLPGTNISWQAHLGGVIVGALVGLIYLATRRPEQKVRQVALISSLAIGLVVLTLLRLFVI